MYLTRHPSDDGPRWALDGAFLPRTFSLSQLLELPHAAVAGFLREQPRAGVAAGPLLAPVEPDHEVWAAGVTYLRSREARESESTVRDVYARVYDAARPELFFKALGRRVVGHGAPIRVRRDSRWNVPEPELTLVVNAHGDIVGYCAGNDVSSRDIEGENPLYLPQAKVYEASCALGPGIAIDDPPRLAELTVRIAIARDGRTAFEGETALSRMKRGPAELVGFLRRELDFPHGVFLMTGTGIVPGEDFSLGPGDVVRITIGDCALENAVAREPERAP